MKVFKFGGASVKDANSVKNVAQILNSYPGDELIVVLSAMGKMTNAFEDLTESYFHNSATKTSKFLHIKRFHESIVQDLFTGQSEQAKEKVNFLFSQIEAFIEQPAPNHYKGKKGQGFDYIYDQLVSFGELLSTTILSEYLHTTQIPSQWLDARKLVITDDHFREANVNWAATVKKIKDCIEKTKAATCIYVTQGFIGGTTEGITTTLGREGSDYTGAIFAYALDAKEVTIWKDVPGLLNADPRYLENTRKIDRISYREAIELAYYGAKIIHPKTIKPLQNRKIPLYIKSFAQPKAEGSVITDKVVYDKSIPSYIFKLNQVLISITTRDYSFITETHLHQVYGIFAAHHIKINVMQNSAISLSVCADYNKDRITELIAELKKHYYVRYNDSVELITIRYYNTEAIEKAIKDKSILLEQRSRITLQLVVQDNLIHNHF